MDIAELLERVKKGEVTAQDAEKLLKQGNGATEKQESISPEDALHEAMRNHPWSSESFLQGYTDALVGDRCFVPEMLSAGRMRGIYRHKQSPVVLGTADDTLWALA